MITKILGLIPGSKKILGIGIASIALVVIIGYGVLKIQGLEATIDAREQRIEMLETEYTKLNRKFNTIDQDFRDFVTQVQQDLNEQRLLNSDVRNLNREYRQRVDDLERTFMYDGEGNLRNWDDIIDNNSSTLQQLINEKTRGIGREFEEISSGR